MRETYYDILGISSQASIAEIIASYKKIKNTLFYINPQLNTEDNLAKIEQAYGVLSDLEKRVQYDHFLSHQEKVLEHLPSSSSSSERPSFSVGCGSDFTIIREKCGYSMNEVSQITKIPLKYLKALEEDDFEHLPQRVYSQGYIRMLAKLYQLDPHATVKKIIQYYYRD